MTDIGGRLKEERERLGFSQPSFGSLGGKTKKTVMQWESGEQFPNAAFLAAIAAHGADVQYIITGRHGQASMTEAQELAGYVVEVLSPPEAQAVRALRASGALHSTSIQITGDGNQAAGRDLINHSQGAIHEKTRNGGRRKG